MKKIIFFILSLCILALAGCQKDGIENGAGDGTVKYAVALGKHDGTKAAAGQMGASAILADKSGNIAIPLLCEVSEGICSSYAGDWQETSTKGTMVNTSGSDASLSSFTATVGTFTAKAYNRGVDQLSQTVTWNSGTGVWVSTPTAFWPQATILDFLAYANLPGTQTAQIAPTGITMAHTVPATASEQTDILFGHYQGNGEGKGIARIRFEHPLTAVRFLYGEIDGNPSIKSITIGGVAASGTATMAPDGIISWSGVSGYSQSISQANESGLSVDGTTKLIGEPFIIIPQDLESNNVTIVLTLSDGRTFEASINAGEWQQGKTNTYTLGISSNPELLDGMFSVSETEYVQFSRGNLFCTDKGESELPRYAFDFEANQYDFRCRKNWDNDQAMINGAPTTTPASTSGQFQWLTANSLAGENDLACYGAFSEFTKDGARGLASDQLNYGLCMGAENRWYTLSESEYTYLINSRPNAAKLRKWCSVCGVNGLLLAPDVESTLSAVPDYLTDYTTKEAWKVAVETYGLVFLPATGYLCCQKDGDPGDPLGVNGVGSVGYYYSLSSNPSDEAFQYLSYYLGFNDAGAETGNFNRNYARSVRLVKKFDKPEVTPTFINLDLPSGTLWADVNVGAISKTGVGSYGKFYAWGETETKATFTIENYKFTSSFNKYNGTDGLTRLQSEDDVAALKVSGSHIPTRQQFEGLLNSTYTTYSWEDDYSGVPGLLITSKSNGNSVFFPAAGLQNEDGPALIGNNGCYWSSTLNPTPNPSPGTAFPACAIDLDFDNTRPDGNPFVYRENDDSRRLAGQSIRPVKSMPYTITGKPVTGCETMGTVSGSGNYEYGQTITLTATPEAGCIFLAWNDGNTDAERHITVTGVQTFTAMFQEHYVDLGLPSGKRWCNSNVGASLPWEKGNYYSYGALAVNYTLSGNAVTLLSQPQESDRATRYPGDWDPSSGFPHTDYFVNAPYSNGESWTRYNNSTETLRSEDDVAYFNDHSSHIPDGSDYLELADNTMRVPISNYLGRGVSGVIVYKARNNADKGVLLASSTDGVCTGPSGVAYSPYNSVHIFFPVMGYIDGLSVQADNRVFYRSRTRSSIDYNGVLHYNMESSIGGEEYYPRNTAFPVRGIKD